MKILYAWLPPAAKIYPAGVVAIADYVHKKLPEAEQKIIDLSLVDEKKRMDFLLRNVDNFDPDIVAFSWRDIQIFSPKQEDRSLEMSFRFYYSMNPLDKINACIFGIKAMLMYKTRTHEIMSYINAIKNRTVVLGGSAFSLFAEWIMEGVNDNVIGIIGEGERAFLRIIEAKRRGYESGEALNLLKHNVVLKKKNKIIFGRRENFVEIEDFTPVDFDYISEIFPQFGAYLNMHIGVQAKRGCPFRCIFCSYPYIEGRVHRYKKPDVVFEEMRTLYDNFGVKKFWFLDSNFVSSPKTIEHCNKILEMVRKELKDIEWGGYIRIDNINKELAENMVKTGINFFEISITSGSQRLINFMKMGYRLDRVLKACELIKSSGYDNQKVIINYSLNAPHETKETLKESIITYKKMRNIFGYENVLPYIFFLGIQPHTELERYAIETGYLNKNYDPLAINPRTAKKLIYNPPPLNKMLARTYLKVMKECNDREKFGIYYMEALEKKLES